jgi:hypothetical protein
LHRSYHAWEEAGRFYLKALHTGKVTAFSTREALEKWISGLRDHLRRKYGPQNPDRCFCGEDAVIQHPLNGSPLCPEHADEALDALDELYREHRAHLTDLRCAGYHF